MRLRSPPHLFPTMHLSFGMVLSPQQEIFPGAAFVLSISGADSSLRYRSTGRPAEMECGGVRDVAGCVVGFWEGGEMDVLVGRLGVHQALGLRGLLCGILKWIGVNWLRFRRLHVFRELGEY